jgi:hypothetical protein
MPPGEQHQEELVGYVGVRDIEIMLERRDIYIAIELPKISFYCKSQVIRVS